MYNLLKTNPYFQYFDVKKKHDLEGFSREELASLFHKEREALEPYIHKYENLYMNINNFSMKFFEAFSEGDEVVVHEKIDGSQAHMIVENG
ncbi:MAG: hypothetical protein J6A75_02275 [Lachnospiraceae bacterium]|nr:hypothetical protein [Lachnospiraceae bacterium]